MRCSIGLLTVLALFACSAPLCAQSPTVGYWRFEEGSNGSTASGTGTILDSSGYANHGTAEGGPVYTAVAGVPGTLALQFDGVDDRVVIPDASQYEITGSLTLEAYIRIDSYPGDVNASIVYRGDDRAGVAPYSLRVEEDGQLHLYIYDASGDSVTVRTPDPLPVSELLHVAGTLDADTGAMRVYVNGEVQREITTTLRPLGELDPTRNPRVAIGNLGQDPTTRFFDGIIDEVRISNTALSPSEFLPVPVPEPSTWVLLSVAGLALFVFRRRRRK